MRVAPGGQYVWDGGSSNCVAIMRTPSHLEVIDKVRHKVPAGRTVRAIFGAITNPTPPGQIPAATWLQSEKDVEAFFDLASPKPIRLQMVLRRNPEAMPLKADSPPPDNGDIFPVDFLNAPDVCDDPGKDSDSFHQNLAGYAKRTIARMDEDFKDWKMAAPCCLK